jgi:hypothetical protein
LGRALRAGQRIRTVKQLVKRLHGGLRSRRDGADNKPQKIVADAEIVHSGYAGCLQGEAAVEDVIASRRTGLSLRDKRVKVRTATLRRVERAGVKPSVART